jgi:hypothetical protein
LEDIVKFESLLERLPGKGGEFYMTVPDEIVSQFVNGRKPTRIRCNLNDSVDFQCAIRPRGGGGFYINVATQIRQKGKLRLGQKLYAMIKKDDSEYGRDMPVELSELLGLDDEGNRLFHEQLPSMQRNIIHYISGAKSIQIRIDRAIMMIERLKGKPKH